MAPCKRGLKVLFWSTLHSSDLEIDVEFDGSFSHCTTLYEADQVLQVYIFIFASPAGCRAVSAEYHGRLPPCTDPTMNDAELLQVKSSVNVSSSYYYTNMSLGLEIEYMEDGSYTMKYKRFSPTSEITRRSRK